MTWIYWKLKGIHWRHSWRHITLWKFAPYPDGGKRYVQVAYKRCDVCTKTKPVRRR